MTGSGGHLSHSWTINILLQEFTLRKIGFSVGQAVGRYFYLHVNEASRRNRSAKRAKEGNAQRGADTQQREILNGRLAPSSALFLMLRYILPWICERSPQFIINISFCGS